MIATPLSFTNFSSNLPPQNVDAEESILGGILLDAEAIKRVASLLVADAFYITAHKEIYKAALTLHAQGVRVDLMTVTGWLHDHKLLEKIGGQSKLAQLVERTVSAVNVDLYATLVMEKYQRRQLIQAGNEIVQLAYDNFMDFATAREHIEEKINSFSFMQTDDDPEYQRYTRLIESIRELELNISDPGYRTWRLQKLARKNDRTPKQLEELYFKSLVKEENEPIMDFDEALNKHGSSIREWLLHGFLPRSSTILLHAEGGVGKTRLAYEFCFNLATGQSWDGFPVTAAQRRCLIVQTDEPAADMLSTLADRGVDSSFSIRYKTRWTVEHIQSLRKDIQEYQPDVIVIDSLSTVSRHSLFTENDVEYARPILLLRDIAQEFGCTIIIIHHDNKSGGARGTSAIFNSVSEVLSLKRNPSNTQADATDRILTIEKSRSRRPARYRLSFNPEDKSWSCLGKEGEDENNPNLPAKEAIVNFLSDRRGVAYEVPEIQASVGGSINHLRRCAYDLSEDGVISRIRKDPKSRKSAYKYFIGGSGGSWGDQKPITSRSVNDQIHDQIESADTASITPSSDHLITKNKIFQQQDECEKNANLTIRRSDDPQTPVNQENPTDLLTDHQVITSDHQLITPTTKITSPQPNQRVIVCCAGSKNDGKKGTVLRLVELEDKSTEALVKLDKGSKIHVPVPGSDRFCLISEQKAVAAPENNHQQLALGHQEDETQEQSPSATDDEKYAICLVNPNNVIQFWCGSARGFSGNTIREHINLYIHEATAARERDRILERAEEIICPNWKKLGYQVRYNTVQFFKEKANQ